MNGYYTITLQFQITVKMKQILKIYCGEFSDVGSLDNPDFVRSHFEKYLFRESYPNFKRVVIDK